MRDILIIYCALISSCCVAIPFVFPASSAKLVAIGNESPHIDTLHPTVGPLRDINSNVCDGQDKREILHDSAGCFSPPNAQDDAEKDGKLVEGTHKLASYCENADPNLRLLSRKHNGTVRKGHHVHAAGLSPKSAVVNANNPHWFQNHDYRRSPMLDFLKVIGHTSVTSTSTGSPHMKPTQAPSTPTHHNEKMKKGPASSQGSDGSHPDGWGAYRDWKQ